MTDNKQDPGQESLDPTKAEDGTPETVTENPSDLPKIATASADDIDGVTIKSKPVVVTPSITLKRSGVSASLDDTSAPTQLQQHAAPTQVRPKIQSAKGSAPPQQAGVTLKGQSTPAPPSPPGGGVIPSAQGDPDKSFVERHRTLLLAAIACLSILLIVGVFLLIKSLTTPEQEKILASSAASIDDVDNRMRDAELLADISAASHGASRARRQNALLIDQANRDLSGETKAQVAAVLNANAKLLDAYSALAEASANRFLKDPGRFDKYRNDIEDGVRAVQGASTASVETKPKYDPSLLTSAQDNVDDVLQNADEKLTAWDKDRDRKKAAKRRFTAQHAAFQSIYDDLWDAREVTKSFVHASNKCTSGDEIVSMQDTRASLADRASSQPAGPLLNTVKSRMIELTGKSVDGVDSLYDIYGSWRCHSSGSDGPMADLSDYQSSYIPINDDVNRAQAAAKQALDSSTATAESKYKAKPRPQV